jgi:hypothetical protein
MVSAVGDLVIVTVGPSAAKHQTTDVPVDLSSWV